MAATAKYRIESGRQSRIFLATSVTKMLDHNSPLCMVEGTLDYWKLLFLIGIPFGIQKMFVWLMPSGYGIGETVGMLAVNLLIGGVIGSFILVWRLSNAVFTLAKGFVLGAFWITGIRR